MFWLQLMLSLFCLLNNQMCFELALQDCWTASYDVVITLDCRDEISFQYEIYSSLHKYFASNMLNRISFITYKVNDFRVIKSFDESFSDDHQGRIYNKTFECPREISLDDIHFNTKAWLDKGRKRAKKLAFVIILANFNSPSIDNFFVREEKATQKNQNDILRIFIIINMHNHSYKNDFFIYDSDLKMSKTPLIKYLGTLCSTCGSDQISFKSSDQNNKKCYSLGDYIVQRSMTDAMSECKGVFDLIDSDSKEEFNFLRSVLINQLIKLRVLRAAVLIKQKRHRLYNLKPKRANDYEFNPNRDLCTVWMFKCTLAEVHDDISVMWNRSVINVTSFTDQLLPVACDEKLESLKLCEVDLTLYTNVKSYPLVFDLPYQNIKFGEPTLVPKKYVHGFLKDRKIYDGNIFNLGKITYVPKNCTDDDSIDIVCRHILKCHADDNYRRSFCNPPVQYIYKHSFLTEYYNYQVVNISGLLIDIPKNIDLNVLNETRTYVQPNTIMLNESIFKLRDYQFSKKDDIVPCKHFNKENVKKLSWGQKEDINIMENNRFLFDSDKNRPSCIFSRSVSEQCPAVENEVNCSGVVCPANFIKCSAPYCVFLGEELGGTNHKCYSLESAESDLSKYFHCSVRLKSILKQTCFIDDFPNSIKHLYNGYACDFPCDQSFKCIQGHNTTIIKKKTLHQYKVFDQSIEIWYIYGNYKIHPEQIPFLSLLDHAEIYASDCGITAVLEFFQDLDISQLISLDLSNNFLFTSKNLDGISSVRLLRYLNLSHNRYFYIKTEINFPMYLETIDFSYTEVKSIPPATFDQLVYLKYLYLSHTNISNFMSIGLKPSFDLKVLDLRGTLLQIIKNNYFENLTIQTALFVSDYKFCCPQVAGPQVPQEKCYSPKGPLLSSCKDLIGDSNKRYILWLVGLVAFVSNSLVVVYRLVWDRLILKKAYGLFVTCLGVSDLIMGLYLLVIAAADSYFKSLYVLNDTKWRHGNVCKFAGFLATFSSESSAFFICLITIERYCIMRYPFGELSFSKKGGKSALILTWSVSFILAVIPTFPLDWDIYSSNSMCLSLPLNFVTNKGWKYSFCVLVLLNFVTFLFILMGQISVFRWFAKNKFPESSMITTTRNVDLALAKNLAFVALSDFLCWFPIAIMGFISLAGYKFGNEAYSWSAVLVIPINSALNPIIYTFPAIKRKIRTMQFFY